MAKTATDTKARAKMAKLTEIRKPEAKAPAKPAVRLVAKDPKARDTKELVKPAVTKAVPMALVPPAAKGKPGRKPKQAEEAGRD
ncbi:MAG TPA: hypothetical protein VM528_07550, partial [Burkholderiaceae bacterium]|nr:hypothetical protein [Burkholderiaceae bacterium]